MADLARSDIVDILNELLSDDWADEILFQNHPTLAMMRDGQEYDFTGRYVHVPVQWKRGGGRSASLSKAISNGGVSGYEAFDVTLSSNFGKVSLDGMTMDLAKHGASSGMFINHLEQEMKGGMSHLGDDIAMNAFRNSGGARGQRGSVSGSTLTLSNVENIRFFAPDMVITAATTDGTSGSERSGSITVTSVDRDAGTFDFTGTITSFADNDYLFVDGDFGVKCTGLDAWCPSAAPGATTFYGVDRSQAPVELGGVRFTGTTFSPEELFIRMNERASRDGLYHDLYICHPSYFAEVEVTLQGKREVSFESVPSEYEGIGFDGISVRQSGKGGRTVALIKDPDCQEGIVWGLHRDYWKWYTLGDAPRKVTEDGLEFLRGSGDTYDMRLVARSQFLTPAPWSIMRTSVSA